RIAELLGGRAEDVALLPGCSAGVQTVALCYPWAPGDRVVLFDGEFPANVTPWQRAAALHGLELAFVPLDGFAEGGGGRGLEDLEAELRRGARVVAVSAVQFRTGLRMPLAEMAALAAGHGAEIFVDAIQACGAVPLDAAGLGLDYLACGAHKWLMGIEGAGFLWVRPGRARHLQPHLAGWLSHEDPLAFLLRGPGHLRRDRPLRHDARALEPSSPSTASQAALLASIEILLGLGIPAVEAHAGALCDGLEALLRERGFASLRAGDPARRSAFFSARLPPGVDGPRLRAALGERGVVAALPDGLLRLAPHWPNAPGEAKLVGEALDEALAAAG
ncbi:MAG TPA: aminotransferase class V-fold PLP-dependent enzyme, partial [Anaeromyxobacteraceae bacterium]